MANKPPISKVLFQRKKLQTLSTQRDQNMKRIIAAMTFAGAIAGCGGGGEGGRAAPVAKNTVLIESYGDSTTAGYQLIKGVGSFTPNSEPAELQATLQTQLGATVSVSNQGVSATEASQLLYGTDGVHPAWPVQMANSKAQIVTLNFALNDAYYSSVVTANIIQETPALYAQTMTTLIQVAKAAGKQVVLMEPNPTCEPIRQAVLPIYVAALNQVAQQQGVPIVHHFAQMSTLNWQSYLTDCLHPTDAGYLLKANQDLPVIAPMVQLLL